jgi:hypothetical protein
MDPVWAARVRVPVLATWLDDGEAGLMQFTGVLPEDAPDPQLEMDAQVRSLPFDLIGLDGQPALEDAGLVSLQESRNQAGPSQISATVSYQLWRNPLDRDDPVNLAELDDAIRTAIEQEPPWPRPAWLIERAKRLRYPLLWEAVRTTWTRKASEYSTLEHQLVNHANHILMNQYREQLGLEPGPTGHGAWSITESAVNSPVTASLNGAEVPAAEIDTDPNVYAIGLTLDPFLVVTAVIAREHLHHVRVEFATRALPK